MGSGVVVAEDFPHHDDQLKCAGVAHSVIDPVGVLAGEQHTLVAQDGEMLGDVALRGADGFNNILYTDFLTSDHAKDLEAQGVGNRLEGPSRSLDMLLFGDEINDVCFHEIRWG